MIIWSQKLGGGIILMCPMQMVVAKKEKCEDANSNNSSDKEDHNAIFMEKDEEIACEEQNK